MKCVDQDQADGDRVILLPEINSREYPCHGWSDVETQQQQMIVETVTVPLPILCLLLMMRPPEWGSGHCLEVEAGVAAAPAIDSDA